MSNQWIFDQVGDLADLARRVQDDAECRAALEQICALVLECLKGGHKVLAFGNGGSATDAMHLCEELIGRFRTNRRPLPAVSLAADATALTCIANDFGYDEVFARQVEGLCAPGDVVVGFSTGGNSENIVRGLKAARAAGARTIGMLGKDGGAARAHCDVAFVVPSTTNARIQEIHTLALHLACEAVEREFGV